VADPIKISQYEVEEDVKEPVRTEIEEPEKDDERRAGQERRALADTRAVGFFRSHPRAKWLIAAVVILLLIGGFFIWRYYSVRESTDDAQVDGHINPISPRVTGTVVNVLHDDNEVVQAGTLLVELDPKDYQVALIAHALTWPMLRPTRPQPTWACRSRRPQVPAS